MLMTVLQVHRNVFATIREARVWSEIAWAFDYFVTMLVQVEECIISLWCCSVFRHLCDYVFMRIPNDSYRPPEWVCLKTFQKSLRCTFMQIHSTHPLNCTYCEVYSAQNLQFTAMINHFVQANEHFFQRCLYDWGFLKLNTMNTATY